MLRSCLLPLHEAAGARLTGDPDRPEVLTYGDVPAEYAAAQEGCALFDETDRGLLRVTGAERQVFLHRLTSNAVQGLEPGQGSPNLLLTSKGKVAHSFDLLVEADEVRLSTPAGGAEGLRTALDLYLFTEDVGFEDATEEHAPIALCGPRADALLAGLTADDLEVEVGHARTVPLAGVEARLVRAVVHGSPGWRVDAGPAGAPVVWSALVEAGAAPAGLVVRDSLRVEAGAAMAGVDVSEDVYPQEARLEAAFSLEKGCYIGQEVVAKIDTYGGLNKRLVALSVSHDDPVAPGTPLVRDDDGEDRRLGLVTSWAYSFALDGGAVLAYVKRRHQAVGTTFRLGEAPGGGEATVVALPLREGAVAPTGEFE